MKLYTIYRHINKVNGKSYIGQTSQKLTNRWKSGKGYTLEHQPAFYNAIKKYGWDNFEHEILEEGIKSLEEANVREKYWVEYYHTWIYDSECNGYNITKGGDGTPGHKMSEQTKAKIKKAVYCIELDRVFESMSSAARETGCLVSKISLCCKGHANSTGGYHWRYFDETLAMTANQTKKNRLTKKADYYQSMSMPVYCIVDDTKKFTFSSRTEAAKWWFDTYRLFGPVFYRSTYLKKINQSIAGEDMYTGTNKSDRIKITNIKWFLQENNNG